MDKRYPIHNLQCHHPGISSITFQGIKLVNTYLRPEHDEAALDTFFSLPLHPRAIHASDFNARRGIWQEGVSPNRRGRILAA